MKVIFALAVSLSLLNWGNDDDHPLHEAGYRFINGRWFDGKNFVPKTMYSINGIWSDKVAPTIDSTFDLHDQYIVPPFSEAHTHMLEGVGDPDARVNDYLRDGVFYVKNPNNIRPFTEKIRSKLNTVHSLDAVFANGGITSTGGHPEPLYEDQVRQHIGSMVENAPRGWFRNKSYFNVDSEEDFNNIWPVIKDGKPDFIKVYLANSEDWGKVAPPSKYILRKGLNPALVPMIVTRAHQDGFRVSAHVETRQDFRTAVDAGVDEITHTPGFYLFSEKETERYRLTREDCKLAASKKIDVVTTILSRNLTEDQTLMPLVEKMQAYNLDLLHRNGVVLAIGSDHAKSPVDEVNALRRLAVFDDLTILKIWCEATPLTIFPDRKLGMFKDGYEASFLALPGNPLKNWGNMTKITMRFKHGHVITVN